MYYFMLTKECLYQRKPQSDMIPMILRAPCKLIRCLLSSCEVLCTDNSDARRPRIQACGLDVKTQHKKKIRTIHFSNNAIEQRSFRTINRVFTIKNIFTASSGLDAPLSGKRARTHGWEPHERELHCGCKLCRGRKICAG